MKAIVTAAVAAAILAACAPSQAASIWAKREGNSRGLYSDDVARQIGDVLTVIISESSRVDNQTSRDLEKATSRSVDFNGELGIGTPNHNILPRIPGVNMSATSANTLNGSADFSDKRNIADRITVVVEDILPNGNLVVIGSRQRIVEGDTQTVQVSGIVRPSDVTFANTITSAQVADFRIVTATKGISEPYTRPGWFGKILDFVWPF